MEGDGRGGPGGVESDHELAGLEGVDDQLDELHVVVNQPVGLQQQESHFLALSISERRTSKLT